jgi:hypothetical protein
VTITVQQVVADMCNAHALRSTARSSALARRLFFKVIPTTVDAQMQTPHGQLRGQLHSPHMTLDATYTKHIVILLFESTTSQQTHPFTVYTFKAHHTDKNSMNTL